MGLDMTLMAEGRFYPEWNKKGKEHKKAKAIRKLFPEMFKSGNLNTIAIGFEAGYWRKANHIHRWFVENVQEGEDDCGKYYVDREDLIKLLGVCRKVLEKAKTKESKVINGYKYENGKEKPNLVDGKVITNPETIAKLLPTQGGFFFGGTEYDEYYLNSVKKTVKIIKKCLKLPKEWRFEYHSSW